MSSATANPMLPSSTIRSQPRTSLADHRRQGAGGGSLAAQGEPMIWLAGGALAIALAMIVGLLGFILVKGTTTFWPGVLRRVERIDGTVYLGEVTRSEWYRLDKKALAKLPPPAAAAARAQMAAHGGRVHRRLFRTANFELTGTHFHWVDDFDVLRESEPTWPMVLERVELGRFYGTPTGLETDQGVILKTDGLQGDALSDMQRKIWDRYGQEHPRVAARRDRARHLEKYDLGRASRRAEQARLAVRKAAIDFGKDSDGYHDAEAAYQRTGHEVQKIFAKIRAEVAAIETENKQWKLTFATAQCQSHAISMADIVRMYPANQLSLAEKIGIYLSRWGEFLFDNPREANSEGGVWPAIVGTVTMTLLMAIAVVPFGVLAALYLHEYAKPGPVMSVVRISINNLAGVPSIVFGVFGLGFFCYIVGAGVDHHFFYAQLADGNPVFGKGGLAWASLTLALLTLPVVIVAAEESLSAVPHSMREGSYACGAGKWQTIRRIILPHALPGIMTGMILAMARGAGEVAPLMLVGAVKLAPDLPVDKIFPFFHPDRSFMHLGFHIYDLGFQSPNSEAAKPMVFTTTLLLIAIIATLNLIAVWLRRRLLNRFRTHSL